MKQIYYFRGCGGIKIRMRTDKDPAQITMSNNSKSLVHSIDLRIITWDQLMTDANIDTESSMIYFNGRVRHPIEFNAQMSWFNDEGDGLINYNPGGGLILVQFSGLDFNPG